MKIIIAGDYCDRYRVSEKIKEGDYTFLLGEVKPIVESADVSIVNFEFPVVLTEGKPIPKCGPNLRGQKESVDAIKYAGFNVCTLANNHILDQGDQCCLDTKRLIEEAGMKTVGAGKNLAEASEILYVDKDGEKLAIINCCEHEFSIATDNSAGANPLNPIRQYYKIKEARQKADYVLVIVHGGHEHYQLPSPRMKETYRFFIDAGADAVVNHHQHCYSGYEEYRNKPIFYGLGNFCFDNPSHRAGIWNEGFMLQIEFGGLSCSSFSLLPYTQCQENPGVTLMEGEDEDQFQATIVKLNNIIADDLWLKRKHEEMMSQTADWYMTALQPYRSRVCKALYVRGLLPSFVKNQKRQAMINYITCESHIDRLRFALCKKGQ